MKKEDLQPTTNSKKNTFYKWFVLISLCMNSMTNLFFFTAYTPIWSFVAVYYNTTDYNLNWFTNAYQIGPMIAAFFFNPLIIKYFGVSQILSCSLTSFGLWLLVMVQQDYYLGLLAFTFLGAGVSFFYQVPLYLSKIWFDPEDRILSTFIGQYSSNVGMLVGYAGSAFYFNGITDFEQFKPLYENMIRINAILSILSLVASFVTLKDPYYQCGRFESRETIGASLFKICTTQEGIYDLLSVGSFIGVSWTYTALFGTQQYMIGQQYLDVIWASINFQSGQIIAACFCTWQLMKQSKKGMQQEYDKYIKYTMGLGFWFLIIEILLFEILPVALIMFMNFFIGAGLGGLYSVLLESLMEKHFPVQELAIGTLMSSISSTESFVITMILVIPQFLKYGFQISAYLMIPSYCYVTAFYNTKFKRFESEI